MKNCNKVDYRFKIDENKGLLPCSHETRRIYSKARKIEKRKEKNA